MLAAAVTRLGSSNRSFGSLPAIRRRRRRHGTVQALRRLRDDAYRVHDALDDLRDTFHGASPGLIALGRSLQRVRRSLDGTGEHIVDLGCALRRNVRRDVD